MNVGAAVHAALWMASGSVRRKRIDTDRYGERRSLPHMLAVRGAEPWRAYGSIRRIRIGTAMSAAYDVGLRRGAAAHLSSILSAVASAEAEARSATEDSVADRQPRGRRRSSLSRQGLSDRRARVHRPLLPSHSTPAAGGSVPIRILRNHPYLSLRQQVSAERPSTDTV